MTQTNRFALMLEALTELAVEEQANHAGITTAPPSLRDVLSSAAPLPSEALFLGLADDGLTVLLNLYDPVPGPLLITSDSDSGNTALLQVISRATELMHTPSEVEFAVITGHLEEWNEFKDSQNLAGLYSTRDNATQDLLYSLVNWAHNNRGEKQSVILMIDDLDSVIKLSHDAEQNLRWLLLRGPSRRVWPIVTLKPSMAKSMEAWLGFFHTRLFGRVDNKRDAEMLTGLSDNPLNNLASGSQFSMREGNNWLSFWIPTLD